MSLFFDKCMLLGECDDHQTLDGITKQPPYLLTDLYPLDEDDPKTLPIEDAPWEAGFKSNPQLIGGTVKLYDAYGLVGGYGDPYQQWGVRNMKKIIELGMLAGGYTFTRVGKRFPPIAQIEPFGRLLEAAGWPGYARGVIACIDLEESPENNAASTQEIIDSMSIQAEWLKTRFGRPVMVYGRGIMRDKYITSRMGCDFVWNPAYTASIVLDGLIGKLGNGAQAAWDWDSMPLWQPIGDGVGPIDSAKTHVPHALQTFGRVDIDVVIDGANAVTWKRVESTLLAGV